MTKIVCAAVGCKYNDDDNVCTAPKVAMSEHSIMTLYDGRQQFWKCKQYEESEISKYVTEQFKKLIDARRKVK